MNTKKSFFTAILFMKEVNEGFNTKVRRLFPRHGMDQIDPFLLFDYFAGKLPGGFPDHPHRGFETVTYLISGRFLHEDFKGHKGELKPGSVQWMTAGRGIVHSEIPASDKELSVGYQLWINLPKAKKMIEPHYQEFAAEKIPEVKRDGMTVKVISGELYGVKGAINYEHPVHYYAFDMQPGNVANYELPAGWNGFVVVNEGEVDFGSEKVGEHHGAIFAQSKEVVKIEARAVKKSQMALITGKPINEPIVRSGPFVMSTREEIEQAFDDYSKGRNGFEGRIGWRSQNSKLIKNFDDEEDI